MKIYELKDLLESMEQSGKTYDKEKIMQAFQVADKAHAGVCRVSGEPYISHPVAVACILVGLGMDSESIEAALLHDVVEDTCLTIEEIRKPFGADVAALVDGVTKLGKISFSSREEQQAENVRKMLLAMAQDVRVIIIKLSDRLHNMRTMEVMKEQKRRDKALETMEVYAPLAHRLGIRAVKEELEEYSLRYLDPVAYEEIERSLSMKEKDRERFLDGIKQKITQRLQGEYEGFSVDGRIKSIYGIYRKTYVQNRTVDEIYDIYAVRIIVNTVMECYNVLGIIHDMFQPLPNRFKDYISTPKPNMYQSLHTTVVDKSPVPFEVQIRTWDMHHTAEYGIAAHWKYKAGLDRRDKLDERLAWIRQILETQQETDDVEDILQTIKSDLIPEEIFVFTPRGDVINLPAGATVIDFAYAIHSEVGNHMVGAKIDGRLVPIDTVVRTGQIVEIVTTKDKNHAPSRDWLKIVKTSEARAKIRNWYKKERREENIEQGRNDLERELRRCQIALPEDKRETFLLSLAKRQHFEMVEDFYAAIGYGGVLLSKIMPRVRDDYMRQFRQPMDVANALVERIRAKTQTKRRRASGGVLIEGLDDCLVRFAHCCKPLPGDEIMGFITRGNGVTIHKIDCKCAKLSRQSQENQDRWVKAVWDMGDLKTESFKSSITITADGRPGVLAEVSVALANMHIAIHTLMAREAKNHESIISVTMTVNDKEQLDFIINNLKRVNGVLEVSRKVDQ